MKDKGKSRCSPLLPRARDWGGVALLAGAFVLASGGQITGCQAAAARTVCSSLADTNRAVANPPSSSSSRLGKAHTASGSQDETLTRILRQVLELDPATRSFAKDSSVQHQTAILKGRTFDAQVRKQAERVATKIPGILAVRDFIVTETNADLAIAERVRALFDQEPGVAESSIGVSVVRRRVFLSGSAFTAEQATRLGELAQGVPGVEGVSNGLDVAGAKGRVPTVARLPGQTATYWRSTVPR